MNKKIKIAIIIVLIIAVIIGVVSFVIVKRQNETNKSIFERKAVAQISYNISTFDGKAKFDYTFYYDNEEICIVFNQKDEYTKSNYYDGGIKISKKNESIEIYGIEQLKSIEKNISDNLMKLTEVKHFFN